MNLKTIASLTTVGLVTGLGFALWSMTSDPPVSTSTNEDSAHHIEAMKDGLVFMGFEPTTFEGTQWRGKGCRELSYLVDAGGSKLFLFTRDQETKRITATVTRDQVNEQLHRHISFVGSFGISTYPFGDLGDFYYIGRQPDGPRADVYVRLNPDACGVQVDRVAYRTPLRTDITKVDIRILPGN